MAHELDQDAKLSENFKRSEFACKCGCGFSTPDPQLVVILQKIREYFHSPVDISSACRCESHNANVGGSDNSAHKFGLAADISVFGVDPAKVQELLKRSYPGRFGIGSYGGFTHIDVRKNEARWNG